jgi:hypothetical protein
MLPGSAVRITAVIALAAACSGSALHGQEGRPAGVSPGVGVGDCQPVEVVRDPLSRLSKAEYARTVRDLVGPTVADALPALAGLIAGIPDDDTQGGFANINWSLSADHVGGYLGVANEVGVQVVTQRALRLKVLPCAANASLLAPACLETFLDTFATRAYRRPLLTGERAELSRFYTSQLPNGPRALSALMTRVLVSPPFLFKHGAGPVRAETGCAESRIDESYARAARLAYGVWGTMPDAALFAAADAQDLLDEQKLTTQVQRMVRDARARQWLRAFFRQWLHYEQLPVEGYSWPFLGTLDRAHLHDHAVEELDRFIEAIVWTDRGTYRDLMTSRKVSTKAPAIRQIYGLPPTPAAEWETAPSNRAGILTRVALLVNGVDEASLVKRGAMIRRQILCDPLSPPDPAQLPAGSLVPPKSDHRLTTRQRWEARTAPPICQGCHRMINPLGFALEVYDGVGRFRTIESHPVPNTSPETFTQLAINASVMPFVDSRNDPVVDGAVALSAMFGRSKKANTCFVRQLTKFVGGRAVDAADQSAIQGLADTMMRPGGSIQGVLVGIARRHTTRSE